MTITSNPNDKYAFLFTGPTNPLRFVKDIENVYATLAEYYNYPSTHIMVVCGSTDATPGVSSPVINITGVTALDTQLTNFATLIAGSGKTLLFYFTGGGCSDISGVKLVIDGGLACATAAAIDAAWLKTRLNTLFAGHHVNVVMQQRYCEGFKPGPTDLNLLAEWSFTHACSGSEDSFGDNMDGSDFTFGWTRGLQLEHLPPGTPNAWSYADELGSTDRIVYLEEAMHFGEQMQDFSLGNPALATPGYVEKGVVQHLGRPDLLIRDGSPWYESPDIYLSHDDPLHAAPDGDLYIIDALGDPLPLNNTIVINTRNVGTHPVRAYSLGIQLVRFGLGAGVQRTVCDIAPAGGILYPMLLADIGAGPPADKVDTYREQNISFDLPATHGCVRTEAKLVCGDVDFVWSVLARNFEAQRNIDEMPLAPPLPRMSPFPGLQGIKEHVYGIQNRFEEPRLFILALPREYREFQERLGLEWFAVGREGEQERIPLEVLDDPLPHIPLKLEPEQETQFLLRVELHPGMVVEERIKLLCEIWVEGEWPQDARPLMHEIEWPGFAPIAGFSVAFETAASTLMGTVLDPEGKPFPEAKIYLQTVNELQGAETWTDDEGHFAFPEINPDVYHIWAEGGEWRSEAQMVVLLSDRKEQVKLYLTAAKGGCFSEKGGKILDLSRLPFPPGSLPPVFTFEDVLFTTIWKEIRMNGTLWCCGSEESPPKTWNDATVQLDFSKLSHAVCKITATVDGHGPEARLEGYHGSGVSQVAVCPGDKQTLTLSASSGNPFAFARLSGQEAEWFIVHLE